MNKRTLGKVSAGLLTQLFEENLTIFSLDDVVRINKTAKNTARKLVSDLVKRNIIARLKRGKYVIIPHELGSVSSRYIGNYFLAAREVINSEMYYISFYSAMQQWGMLTQPALKVYVSSPKRQKVPESLEGILIIICVKHEYIWGIREVWVTKSEKVRFSDLEKTVIDILAYPKYAGGITEAAKGIWLVRDKIDFRKICKYVKRYDSCVVGKRLGLILDILGLLTPSLEKQLKNFVNDRYDLFDPNLGKTSISKNNWHLIDNVGKEQILNIIKY